MLTLTERGIEKQAQAFMESIHHGSFKVNGIEVDNVPLYKKERNGDTIRLYIMVGTEYEGTISEIKLIDAEGDIVAMSSEVISKPDSKGLYVTFKYKYTEMEGMIDG
ncbi:MAG: hypothetical protein ACI4LO_09625 [Anaerovoracaceae bacterium]